MGRTVPNKKQAAMFFAILDFAIIAVGSVTTETGTITTQKLAKVPINMAQNTAKPIAVVMLAKNKDTLLLAIAVCSALIFDTPFPISPWYLFKIKIQFGTPMIIIRGGIKPDKTVSL